MTKRITIRDVATLAGVSIATVSAVVNKNKYVSPELEQRVLQAIEDLNYVPNLVARSLKLSKTKTIGLIFPNITSPFWPTLARAAQHKAEEVGYDTILANTDEDIEREKKALGTLLSKQVDGIIVTPCLSNNYVHIQEAAVITPIIAVEREVPGIETVITNNSEIVYQAVNHMIDHGYQRIGMVTIPTTGSSTAHRIDGYKRALVEKDLYDPELIREADFIGSTSIDVSLDLLSRTNVDAIITTSRSMTLGTLRAANQLGRHIPDDLALFGFDDLSWMEVTVPPLSTIRQPIEEMARLATELLLQRLAGREENESIHILQSSLVIRSSCGCSPL